MDCAGLPSLSTASRPGAEATSPGSRCREKPLLGRGKLLLGRGKLLLGRGKLLLFATVGKVVGEPTQPVTLTIH
jgi:hypothetical protein